MGEAGHPKQGGGDRERREMVQRQRQSSIKLLQYSDIDILLPGRSSSLEVGRLVMRPAGSEEWSGLWSGPWAA